MRNTNMSSMPEGLLVPGRMLGRYELLTPIGAGGMGNVWAARLCGTRGFRKLVAIKTILQSFEDERFEQMLFQEATLASQIHHPNVVETIELGEHEGTLYLVMELIQGESLACVMRESVKVGGIPLGVSVNLIGQVCRGLSAAHGLCDPEGKPIGLVHRDISPPNLLVTYSGTVKIVDFGVATTSSSTTRGSGEIKGKISYLAPEQLRGDALDRRVDVFATGVVLYLLTVGRHPFKAPKESQTIARILGNAPPTPPSVWVGGYPEELERVVLRALEKDPDQRWQSADEFLNALHRAMPEAFGPDAEKAVADFIGELLHDRMQERRAVLREAEEWTERTSRPTACSLPALVTNPEPPPPASRPRRRTAAFAVAGALLVAGAAAAVPGAVRLVAPNVTPEHTAALSAEATRALAAAPGTAAQRGVEASDGDANDSTGPKVLVGPIQELPIGPNRPAPTRFAASRRSPGDDAHGRTQGGRAPADTAGDAGATPEEASSAELDPVALIDAGLSGLSGLESTAEPTLGHLSVDSGLDDVPVGPTVHGAPRIVPAMAVREPPAPAPAPTPRMLGSRLAHERLVTNPRAEAYRVKLPPALASLGKPFTAKVRICVSERGAVTGVKILQSAGAAIDAQIPSTLGRWRYRPLVENGAAVPFCYLLNYEIAAR